VQSPSLQGSGPLNAPPEASRPDVEARYVKAFLDLVLLSHLQQRPMCGHELMRELMRSRGIALRSGTVYRVLHRLERSGLIAGEWRTDLRVRKIYGATVDGRRFLRQTGGMFLRFLEDGA